MIWILSMPDLSSYLDLFAELESQSVKVGLSPSKKNCFVYFNESSLKMKSPLKMMKNDFYFILKAFFILTIFKFFS